jgi:DNA-binding transcriptional MerR regulator/methylmalonyl-CoA mutase cobalamin-binding subunit
MAAIAAKSIELYPIRTVASLTGVNPVTLRAWERRYGLIQPTRTATGQRLYTQEQIDRVHRVLALLEKGVPVSKAQDALAARAAEPAAARGPWQRQVERMIDAIVRFDEDALEDAYNEALALHPADVVTQRLLLPLLKALGDRWQREEGSVAEEHFFGVYLRNKLGARFHHRPRGNTGPKLLIACLPSELHEVGALLFALSAHEFGYRLVLLGANAPLEDLPIVVKRAAIDVVVLSGSIDPTPELLAQRLPKLAAAAGVPVCVGGQVSIKYRDAIVAAGAHPMGNDIERGLRRLPEILRD